MQKKVSSTMVIIGASVGILVVLYIVAHSTLVQMLGLDPSLIEYWPALMGPNFISLLGADKKIAKKTYMSSAVAGLLIGCSFKLAEAALVPIFGMMGSLVPLFLAVAIIIALGPSFPIAFSPIAFIFFSASTLITSDMLLRTGIRLVTLFVGFTVFYFVETKVLDAILASAAKKAAAKAKVE